MVRFDHFSEILKLSWLVKAIFLVEHDLCGQLFRLERSMVGTYDGYMRDPMPSADFRMGQEKCRICKTSSGTIRVELHIRLLSAHTSPSML